MMDAITGAWVIAIGGSDIIGGILAVAFMFVVCGIFYKITV